MSLHKTYSFDEAALRALIGYNATSPTNLIWLQDHDDFKKGDVAGTVVDGEPGTVSAYWPGCVDKDGTAYNKRAVSLQIRRVVYWLLYPQEDQNDKPIYQVYAGTKVDPLAVGMYFQGEQHLFSLRLKNRDSTLPAEYLKQYAAREAARIEQYAAEQTVKVGQQLTSSINAVIKSPTDTGDCSPTEDFVESSDTKGVSTPLVSTSTGPINEWVATWDTRPVEKNPFYADAGGPVVVQPHIKVESDLKGECVLVNLQHNIAQVFPDPVTAIYSVNFLNRSYSGDWCIIPLLNPH